MAGALGLSGVESGGSCSSSSSAGGGAGVAFEQEHVKVSDELHFVWHRPPMEEVERQRDDRDVVRIFVSGCFDLMHVGHFNILRQAKCLFYQKRFKRVVLVAGLHSDAGIASKKGPPLLCEDERLGVLRAIKWVDELVTGLPYVSMSTKMADSLHVDWICHGDDMPVCPNGDGMYSDVIEHGRFQMLKRTEGISTTRILQRLFCRHSRSSEVACLAPEFGQEVDAAARYGTDVVAALEESDSAALPSALATTHRLAQFAAPGDAHQVAKSLSEAKRIVYVGGTFDLLHAGHVSMLECAAALGDYLLVGVHSDEVARKQRGEPPVLTLLERAMALLSLRFVDDVVLDAPWEVGHDLLATMNVAVVAHGRTFAGEEQQMGKVPPEVGGQAKRARLEKPSAMGILVEVEGSSHLTTKSLRRRFLERREQVANRNAPLLKRELLYVEGKKYVPEA